jgi:signal transduction histidine kinase
VEIRDEGPGLSSEDYAHLFERFQRLSAQPTGGESSTGLGLSIVKQLVGLHGGRVWAESEGLGRGTTFIVELDEKGAEAELDDHPQETTGLHS